MPARSGVKVPNIYWKFNAPRAPWWGGFYERMMGIVKKLINTVLFHHAYPTYDHLQTAVVIANRIINTRPIITMDSDSGGVRSFNSSTFL